MKRLIIVGAGGFGREISSWVKEVQANENPWEVKGFLDDNPRSLERYDYQLPIICSIQDYQPKKDELFVMGIATPPQQKLKIAHSLQNKGANFISLIHPTVIVGPNVKLGMGCVICRNVILTCDIVVGDFVSLNLMTTIGHDVHIDDGCTLHPFVSISGFSKLGKGAEIGSHGCTLPGVEVGDFGMVGAGSVVLKNVKSQTTVIGVPARMVLGV